MLIYKSIHKYEGGSTEMLLTVAETPIGAV